MILIKKITILLTFCLIVAGVSGYLGNKYAILGTDDTTENNDISAVNTIQIPDSSSVNENTVFEFIYNYSDGITDKKYSLPEEYMEGYDREQLMEVYKNWTMESFSPSRVVFAKTIDDESPQHYIIKEYKGYVSVFYRKNGMLKEMTSTPFASLSEKEQVLYKDGFDIDGEENLVKFLEGLET